MAELIQDQITHFAACTPDADALFYQDEVISYAGFEQEILGVAKGLMGLEIAAGDRVALYLPTQPELVYGIFGAIRAGASFVPVNPALKARQVLYILAHCNVRVLITSSQRLKSLVDQIGECPELTSIVVLEASAPELRGNVTPRIYPWPEFVAGAVDRDFHRRIDADMAAILYTSGSTGNPKGVVLSHRNLVAGADSVASYLGNTAHDRLLAVLPLSFDAGLSQLTTAFSVGASVVLMGYLMPWDIVQAIVKYRVTGLAAVPPLWNQLAELDWGPDPAKMLRYITSTGGAMPIATTKRLQELLPDTKIFLMYGLTEAFRSTYLPPEQVDIRPDSMGKAIPNVEILVVDENGKECPPGEQGELVHRGPLVSMGYWNDPVKTAKRFRPCPSQTSEIPTTELAVWSGDRVVRDEEGYLYFVSRMDDMIKTSGFRVSPTEVEEAVYSTGLVAGVAALGLPHKKLGQAILLVITRAQAKKDLPDTANKILKHLRSELPNFMLPQKIVVRENMLHNQNGKIDRRALSAEYQTIFEGDGL